MATPELEPEVVAQQLGAGGVDNLVANAERICDYQQRHIELLNQGSIVALQEEHRNLVTDEERIKTALLDAAPLANLRRLRRRAIYCWLLTVLLTFAGCAFTLMTLAPFRMGWMSWLFAVGIAALTPFLVEKLLERQELLVKVLNALAAGAAVAGLMLLSEVRGHLLQEQLRQNQEQAVVIDDSQTAPTSGGNFYETSDRLLQLAMLFLAFSMEVGAGLALREAWASMPDTPVDWIGLRRELAAIQTRKIATMKAMVDLHNEPGIFAARFWRDFYRAMLTSAVRSAMTKLFMLVFAVFLCLAARASSNDGEDRVIALDLTQSVDVVGPDKVDEFQKDVDGVGKILGQLPAGTRVTVIGITDHTFTQPYILMRARVGNDPGYFGDRLAGARNQLVHAWKFRSAHLEPSFRSTDVLGALRLAQQIFAEGGRARKILIVFSDMRQATKELNLEGPVQVPQFVAVVQRCAPLPDLRGVNVSVLGTTDAGVSAREWANLRAFWTEYFRRSGADLETYSTLRDLPDTR